MNKGMGIALLIFTLIYAGCKTKKESGPEQAEEHLVTQPLIIDTTIKKEYVCQLNSIQHIELRALEKGYLQSIYVDEGQLVRKGQLMFKIMPALYEAEFQKAAAEKDYVEIEYQNTRSLADKNIVSQNELALAKAKLDKSKAELKLAQTHLQFTEVRAPFDGIMGRFNVRLGSLVDEGELLTTLSDNSKMWVYFNVPESEYLNYMQQTDRSGKKEVELQMANQQLFDQVGIVETIEADFNNETGNISFRATFPNPEQILRHGETGNILLPAAVKSAIIIPQQACFDVLEKKYVYVVDKNGLVSSRNITISQELPHLYILSGGLNADDQILVGGLSKIRDGQKIKPQVKSCREILTRLNDLHAE
jgi:membrane fusion protein (multidrug efflux system)